MDLIDDDPQLREALHRAVAGGPPSPPLDDLLLTARRARRRRELRRTTGGLAVAAVVATVAVTGAQLVRGDGGNGRSEDRAVVADRSQARDPLDLGVQVDRRGRLVAESGTTILRTIADPLDRRPDGRSWGVVVQRGTAELWGLVDWSTAGTFTSVEPAEARFAAVEDWLHYEIAAATGTAEPHPVFLDEDGRLRATGATEVVRRAEEVDLGQRADADVLTGAAEITVRGERRFVLARHEAGAAPRYVVLTPRQVGGDFAVLLERAEELWAEARR